MPTHRKCAVLGCESNSKDNREYGFFKFPSKTEEFERYQKWVEVAMREPPAGGRMCSIHFDDAQIANISATRWKLIKRAVPNRNVYNTTARHLEAPVDSKAGVYNVTLQTKRKKKDGTMILGSSEVYYQQDYHFEEVPYETQNVSRQRPRRISKVETNLRRQVITANRRRQIAYLNYRNEQLKRELAVAKMSNFRLQKKLKESEQQNGVQTDAILQCQSKCFNMVYEATGEKPGESTAPTETMTVETIDERTQSMEAAQQLVFLNGEQLPDGSVVVYSS